MCLPYSMGQNSGKRNNNSHRREDSEAPVEILSPTPLVKVRDPKNGTACPPLAVVPKLFNMGGLEPLLFYNNVSQTF